MSEHVPGYGAYYEVVRDNERLRAINAELIRIVLEDSEGDLDFVQFRVRKLIAQAKGE